MANLKFTVDYGMLQAADLNPEIPGSTTSDLTNPRLEDDEEVKQELMFGGLTAKTSPLIFLAAAIAILFVIRYLQK